MSAIEDNKKHIKRVRRLLHNVILELMARAEIDLGPVGQGQLDLDDVVGATGCALQGLNRDTSSPTHGR